MCAFWFCSKDEWLIVLEILDVNSPSFPGKCSSETVGGFVPPDFQAVRPGYCDWKQIRL